MFFAEEQRLDVGFDAARMRLADLLHGRTLITSSADSYQQGLTGVARVGPLGSAPGVSKLVTIQFGELVVRGDSATLPLRWQATGPGGALFPVLDADLRLTALGADCTMLSLVGTYRAPFGKAGAVLDRAVLQRVARATIQSLARRVADSIAGSAGAPAPRAERDSPSPRQPPAPQIP